MHAPEHRSARGDAAKSVAVGAPVCVDGFVDLTWLDPDKLDSRDVDGAVAVLEAARVVDSPHRLTMTASAFLARARHGWDGEPRLTALARDARGRVTGVAELSLSLWDNTHLGVVSVTVDPVARRQGIGRQLFESGVERIRADGRRLVLAESFDQPVAVAFAEAMGMRRGLTEVDRRQDLTTVDWARLDREHAAARGHAEGYELVRIAGAVPDDLIDDVVTLTAAINDAPTEDLDVEDEVFSPERIRSSEAVQVARERRLYRIVARERATGILAGHTVVAVEAQHPWQGWQYDTSVLRAHRGHRLGLLLKAEMMYWLREQEPQLRLIDTGNAGSNAHMIRVNELLGYHVVATAIEWQRSL